MNFILVADSGSTKTDWALLNNNSQYEIRTQGINPFYMTREVIIDILKNELKLALADNISIGSIFFYGAGCRESQCLKVKECLAFTFPNAQLFVGSDLFGAARALCGNSKGIACILGTGANSCYYDGKVIVDNIPAGGYILGDEGSGAVIGKTFIGNILKQQFSSSLINEFYRKTNLTIDNILTNVYKKPNPNRFLASFMKFIALHKDQEEIRKMLFDEFSRFLNRNVKLYNRTELPVHFVGSVAYYFSEILALVVKRNNFILGNIEKAPINLLSKYHLQNH